MGYNGYEKLARLTIVIISKDRLDELSNTIFYWSKTLCKLIIVHDSAQPLEEKLIPKNVIYIQSREKYLERLAIASNFISTPYSMICNDDEVFLINPLIKFITFLDSTKNIEAVGGQVLAYNWSENDLRASEIYPYLQNHSNLNNNPLVRVKRTFDIKNMMDITLMYRSGEFKKIIENCRTFSAYTLPVMGEVMFAFFSSFYCRSKRFEDIYWMRNWFTPFINSKTWSRNILWHDWINGNKFADEVIAWKSKFENVLIVELQISKVEASELIKYFTDWKSNSPSFTIRTFRLIRARLKYTLKKIIIIRSIFQVKRLKSSAYRNLMPSFEDSIQQINSKNRISQSDIESFLKFVVRQKALY